MDSNEKILDKVINTNKKVELVELKDNIINTKYVSIYLDILDDIAHKRIKLENRGLHGLSNKHLNDNHWNSLSSHILNIPSNELAYKYCLYKAKTKVNNELKHEARKKNITLKDSIYIYMKLIRQMIKKNNANIAIGQSRLSMKFSVKNIIKEKPVLENNSLENYESDEIQTTKKNLFTKKFPLNIFVGSNLKFTNNKLKVYDGKYIRTFLVNNSMKKDLTCNTEQKSPFDDIKRGNFVYIEEKTKNNFEKSNSEKIFSKKIKLPKLNIINKPLIIIEEKLDDKSEKLEFIKKMYGLRHFKTNFKKSFKNNQDCLIASKVHLKTDLSQPKTKNSTKLTKSYFKNDEFYYFNSNIK